MRPIINNWMILIKGTSYASIIGVFELTRASREVVERTFRPIEVFLIALVFYFVRLWKSSVTASSSGSSTSIRFDKVWWDNTVPRNSGCLRSIRIREAIGS